MQCGRQHLLATPLLPYAMWEAAPAGDSASALCNVGGSTCWRLPSPIVGRDQVVPPTLGESTAFHSLSIARQRVANAGTVNDTHRVSQPCAQYIERSGESRLPRGLSDIALATSEGTGGRATDGVSSTSLVSAGSLRGEPPNQTYCDLPISRCVSATIKSPASGVSLLPRHSVGS